MKYALKNIALVLMLVSQVSASGLFASETSTLLSARIYGRLEQFDWKEYLLGQEIVRDSGPMYGIGADLTIAPPIMLMIEGNGEFYFGNLDYDGFIQNAYGLEPYRSKTRYMGIKGSGDIAIILDITDHFYLKPYLGIGANAWQRRLDNTGGRIYGYDESWLTLFPFVGLGAGVPISRKIEVFGKAELRLSAYNIEKVDMSNLGGPSGIYLSPGRQPSFCAEAGVNVAFVSLSLFYETLRFGESDIDSKYDIFQPESKADTYGIRLGAVF